MSHPHEDTLRAIYEAFAKGDIETVMGLYTDDIEFHVSGRSPVSGSYSGKDEVLGLYGKLAELSGGTFRVEALDILAFRPAPRTRLTWGRKSQPVPVCWLSWPRCRRRRGLPAATGFVPCRAPS